MPRLQNLWNKYQGHGVQFVALVAGDTDPSVWLAGGGVTFPAIHDPTWAIVNLYYSAEGVPENFIIGRDEIIHDRLLGLHSETIMEGHLLDVIWMRDPVDIEMVMDISSSMNSSPAGSPGGDSKLLLMQRSANIVVNYLTDNGQSNDRVGLVWFQDDVEEYASVGGDKLLTAQLNEATLRAEIDGTTAGGCTAMGAGLQTAFSTLSAEGIQSRFAILCTDGMQNVDPMVTKVGTHYEIIDGGGYCAPHSSVAPVPGVDIVSYDTRIHPISVGITASYATLLQEVADLTGGFYTGTNDPDTDLDLLYMVDLCHCMSSGSPKISNHAIGTLHEKECSSEELFYVNRTTRKITAILSWQKAQAADLTFWLYDPNGSRVNLSPHMRYFEDHCLATIYLPSNFKEKNWWHVGRWRMVIRGETTNGSADYHAFVLAEDNEIHFNLKIPRKVYEVGDYLPVQLLLYNGKKIINRLKDIRIESAIPRMPVAEALASVAFTLKEISPKEKMIEGRLKEKLSAIQADTKLGKQLRPIRKFSSLADGNLTSSIQNQVAMVPIQLNRPGLHTFKVEAFCEVEEQGPVARTDVVTVMVTPGKPSLKQSLVREIKIQDNKRNGALGMITPKSESGYLSGPGLADQFEVRVSDPKYNVHIEDLLDGTYHVEVVRKEEKTKAPKKKRKSAVTVKFCKVELWKAEW